MIDFTTDPSILRTERRVLPAQFAEGTRDLLNYVCHARGAVSHNVRLLNNVKQWPDGPAKRRTLAGLRDNINAWRAKAASAVLAIIARRMVQA